MNYFSNIRLVVAENLGQLIFDYLGDKFKARMQNLSKRFYHIFVPKMIQSVPIHPEIDEFLFSMRSD